MGSLGFPILPFWQANVPEKLRTEECPEFLKGLNDKDRRILGTLDSDYHVLSWEEVCNIVLANNLEVFQRIPSELRRYKAYAHKIGKQHGSIVNFILKERLRWETPIKARGEPFEFADDVKVLYNDWPYGLDPRIVHLVVWTKFELKFDPITLDLTDKARAEIDAYMTLNFRSRVPPSQVMWFKNWAGLKSIHAIEHFHVMMFNPDPDFIRDITNGDVPQCEVADV